MYLYLTVRSKARMIIVRKATSSRFEGCLNLEMLEIRNLEQESVVIQVKIRRSNFRKGGGLGRGCEKFVTVMGLT